MTWLLELREKIRSVYYRYDTVFRTGGRFLLAFGVLFMIYYQIGYGISLFSAALLVILSFVCACLGSNAIPLAMGGMIIYQCWRISAEIGLTAAFLILLQLLLFFSFKPKHGILAAAEMLACLFQVSGILPIAVGLLFSPAELIPMCIGVFSGYMVITARDNYAILLAQNTRLTVMEKVSYYIQSLVQNEKMLLLMAALALTVCLVWWIRRRPYSYSWSIAIPAGLVVFVLTILVGNVLFAVSINLGALIVSCVFAVLAAGAATIFSFVSDGSRSEYLEYEDDEYYYFVKAIPKVSVTVSDKRVTNITQKQEDSEEPWPGMPQDGKEEA